LSSCNAYRIVERSPGNESLGRVESKRMRRSGAGESDMLAISAKPLLRATSVALVMCVLGCGGGGGGGPASPPPSGGTGGTGGSTSADITVQNNSFSPSSTTVPVGTTVTWTWNSCTGDGYGGQMCTDHSIVFDDGGRTNAPLQSSGTFSSTFSTAGTYSYHCSVHGSTTAGMRGTITVQ
jgi:plastocyanin